MKRSMVILSVVGARPNFIKIASFHRALKKYRTVKHVLVHTGQHYDTKMSQQFFDELDIPQPDINLGVHESMHGAQTGEIMKRFEPVCIKYRPDLVVVVGDVNSTIAAALTAVKLGIKVAHIEAGLRSFDRTMPEEINRVLTDAISDYLFVTEQSAIRNLQAEGISRKKIYYVGNAMIDTLLAHKKKAARSAILKDLGLTKKKYAVVTLHRPSNVDDIKTLQGIVAALEKVAATIPVIFPVHPRTAQKLAELKATCLPGRRESSLPDRQAGKLKVIQPLGYLDFLCLMMNARVVLTDSGGVQEETSILGVPCLTLRRNTERPITVTKGTNKVIGVGAQRIGHECKALFKNKMRQNKSIHLWDGKAAERIVKALMLKYDKNVL